MMNELLIITYIFAIIAAVSLGLYIIAGLLERFLPISSEKFLRQLPAYFVLIVCAYIVAFSHDRTQKIIGLVLLPLVTPTINEFIVHISRQGIEVIKKKLGRYPHTKEESTDARPEELSS